MRDVDVDKKNFYSPARVDYAFTRLPQIYRDNIEDGLFRRAEEMYQTAIYLTGCYLLDRSNIYFMRSYEGETPDVLAVKKGEQNLEKNLWLKTNIEVVTLRNFDPRTDIMTFLTETKLSKKKAYSKDDTILLNLMKVMTVNLTKLVEEIQAYKPAFNIFALGKFKEQELGDFFVMRLYPEPKVPLQFNFRQTLKILPTEGKLNLQYGLSTDMVKTHESSDRDDIFEVLGLLDKKDQIITKYGGLV